MPSSTVTALSAATPRLEVAQGSDLSRHRLAGLLALAAFTSLFWTALLTLVLWLADFAFDSRTIVTAALSIAGVVLLFGAAFFTDRTDAEMRDAERRRDRDDHQGGA